MTTWMDTLTYASQFSDPSDLDGPVPRPDNFPETPKDSLSYWIREHPISLDQTCACTKVPEEVDIVIIGSGITGATVAYHISNTRPNSRVALVEARGICTGAKGRKKPSGDMMLECIEKLGVGEKIDLRLNGSLMVFETAQEQEAALKDLDFARSNGYEPEGYYVGPEEAVEKFDLDPSLCKYGAAFIERGGTCYPRKLVQALLETTLNQMPNLSLHPFTPVEAVTRIEGLTSSYRVRTTKGTVTARAVFHATNAYAGNLFPELKGSNGVFDSKAHMVALKPNVRDCSKQLQVGFGYADCWHYLHQCPSHGLFLYGFADAEFLNDYDDTVTLPADHPIRPKMNKFLHGAFPAWFHDLDVLNDATHDWTGIQGLTMSGASIVGRPSKDSPGEFASVGHNGEGMGRCFASATIATNALLAYLDGTEYKVPDWFPLCYRRNI